jgi:hypothetical protein
MGTTPIHRRQSPDPERGRARGRGGSGDLRVVEGEEVGVWYPWKTIPQVGRCYKKNIMTDFYNSGLATPRSSQLLCKLTTASLPNTLLPTLPPRSSTHISIKSTFSSTARHGSPRNASTSCLRSSPSGVYPPTCTRFVFTFFNSIKPKSTWTLLKPSFETLVSTFVFPQLSFNDTKQALWESDPVDYVRVSVGTSYLIFLYPHQMLLRQNRRIRKFRNSSISSDLFPILSRKQSHKDNVHAHPWIHQYRFTLVRFPPLASSDPPPFIHFLATHPPLRNSAPSI